MIALSGVRSSWLIAARKSLLAALAAWRSRDQALALDDERLALGARGRRARAGADQLQVVLDEQRVGAAGPARGDPPASARVERHRDGARARRRGAGASADRRRPATAVAPDARPAVRSSSSQMRSTGDARRQRVQVADEVVDDRLLAEPTERRRRRERGEVAERREERDDAGDDVRGRPSFRAGLRRRGRRRAARRAPAPSSPVAIAAVASRGARRAGTLARREREADGGPALERKKYATSATARPVTAGEPDVTPPASSATNATVSATNAATRARRGRSAGSAGRSDASHSTSTGWASSAGSDERRRPPAPIAGNDQPQQRHAEDGGEAREHQHDGKPHPFAVAQVVEQREPEHREERDVQRDRQERVEGHRQTAARRASSARTPGARSSRELALDDGTNRRTSSGSNWAPASRRISSSASGRSARGGTGGRG